MVTETVEMKQRPWQKSMERAIHNGRITKGEWLAAAVFDVVVLLLLGSCAVVAACWYWGGGWK